MKKHHSDLRSVVYFAERLSWMETMWLRSLAAGLERRTSLVNHDFLTDFTPFVAEPTADLVVVTEFSAIDYVSQYWPKMRDAHPEVRVVLVEMPTDRRGLGQHPAFDAQVSLREGFDEMIRAILGHGSSARPVGSPTEVIDDEDVLRREIFRDALDLQIAVFVSIGLEDKDIAEKLNFSHQTVRARVHRMLERSGFRNRTQLAVALAVRGADCQNKWIDGLDSPLAGGGGHLEP